MDSDSFKKACWSAFRDTAKRLSVAEYINLDLAIPHQFAIVSKQDDVRSESQRLTYDDLLNQCKAHSVSLVGAPGAGKTTLMLRMVEDLATSLDFLPLFVPIAALASISDFGAFVSGTVPPGGNPDVFQEYRFVIAWDGANEAHSLDIEAVFQAILSFQGLQVDHVYLLSTRSADYPAWVQQRFQTVNLLPLAYDAVRDRLLDHCRHDGRPLAAGLVASDGFHDLVALCQLPLFYGIVSSLILESDEAARGAVIEQLCAKRTKYELYGQFIAHITSREAEKRRSLPQERALTPALRATVLSQLGYQMQLSGLVFASEEWIENAVRDIFSDSGVRTRFPDFDLSSMGSLITLIMRSPPLRAIQVSRAGPLVYAFLHQSFGEYFAARSLEQAAVPRQQANPRLDALLDDKTRRHWEVIQFTASGPLGGERFIEYLSDFAMRKRRQDILVLAARCLALTYQVGHLLVADLQIRMLDAFKNWGKAFDYDLIHELGSLASRGLAGPHVARLQDDIRRFVTKYSRRRPAQLRFLSSKELEERAFSDDEEDAVNAIYSLSFETEPQNRAQIAAFLIQHYATLSDAAREQSVATLKELAQPDSGPFLLEIIQNSSESPRCRVFALNAIAQIGGLQYVDPLIKYYRDSACPYRDSAGWSLQMLGKEAISQGEDAILERINAVFWEAIEKEPDEGEGQYIKGNALYSFGVFRATEYVGRMIDYGTRVVNGYILEDLVYGIGLMRDPTGAEFVSSHLGHIDPVVRLKAVESIGLMKYKAARQQIRKIREHDDYPVVRYVASETEAIFSREDI